MGIVLWNHGYILNVGTKKEHVDAFEIQLDKVTSDFLPEYMKELVAFMNPLVNLGTLFLVFSTAFKL